MKQPSSITEEELVLHYYGESERAEDIEEALRSSHELERRYADLRLVLDAVEPAAPPARSDLYGHEVWKRVYPRLEARRWSQLPRLAAWAIAATLLIVVSFWAGRETAPPSETPALMSQLATDRILLVAVADHLERTQFLLLELANGETDSLAEPGIAAARELKVESRLYRQAAQRSGEGNVAYVLEELERFLTELAHATPESGGTLAELLERLERSDLLFKVRVLGSELGERARSEDATPTT